MKSITILFVLSLWWAVSMFGQSATVTASISLSTPSPSCTISAVSNLNYGTVEKPGSGTGSIVINAQTGARTSSTVSISGSSSVGQARLSGSNVANYSVARTFPATLTNSSSSLTYAGTWAQSSSSSGNYTAVSGASYSGTSGGPGATFTHFFRFGGTVSDITLSKTNGTYTGTITATATCN